MEHSEQQKEHDEKEELENNVGSEINPGIYNTAIANNLIDLFYMLHVS